MFSLRKLLYFLKIRKYLPINIFKFGHPQDPPHRRRGRAAALAGPFPSGPGRCSRSRGSRGAATGAFVNLVAFLLFSPPSRDRFKSRERRARPPGGSVCPQPSAALPERPRRSQLTAVISAITVLHPPTHTHAFCSLPARHHPLQPGQERAPGPGAGARRSRRGRAGPRRAGLCRARSAILGKCDRPAGRFEV